MKKRKEPEKEKDGTSQRQQSPDTELSLSLFGADHQSGLGPIISSARGFVNLNRPTLWPSATSAFLNWRPPSQQPRPRQQSSGTEQFPNWWWWLSSPDQLFLPKSFTSALPNQSQQSSTSSALPNKTPPLHAASTSRRVSNFLTRLGSSFPTRPRYPDRDDTQVTGSTRRASDFPIRSRSNQDAPEIAGSSERASNSSTRPGSPNRDATNVVVGGSSRKASNFPTRHGFNFPLLPGRDILTGLGSPNPDDPVGESSASGSGRGRVRSPDAAVRSRSGGSGSDQGNIDDRSLVWGARKSRNWIPDAAVRFLYGGGGSSSSIQPSSENRDDSVSGPSGAGADVRASPGKDSGPSEKTTGTRRR